jgi:hypothetical protein
MSVFLRWGIFGILGVAAMVYAYNASKHMAEKRAARGTPAAANAANAAGADQPAPPPESDPAPASTAPATPPHCEAELIVAERALVARSEGEPLDRLLRIQEIAFQEPARRLRLEKVATDWFNLEGAEPIPEALRIAVISNCVRTSPAP